jgi:stage II sporulation protein M
MNVNLGPYLVKNILGIVPVAVIVFFLSMWLGIRTAVIDSTTADAALDMMMDSFSAKGIIGAGPWGQVWLLFTNNLWVCVLLVVIGVVPFLFLPAVLLFLNGFISGLVMSAVAMPETTSRLAFFLAGLLPHGIFEFAAIFLAGAMGLNLCSRMIRKILRQAGDELNLKAYGYFTVKSFAFIVAPLLLVAALVESLVTPRVVMWVIGLGV